MASTESSPNNQTIQNKIGFNLSKIQIMLLVVLSLSVIIFVSAIIVAGAFQSQNKSTKEALDKNTKNIENIPGQSVISPLVSGQSVEKGTEENIPPTSPNPTMPLGTPTPLKGKEHTSAQVDPLKPQPPIEKPIPEKDSKNIAPKLKYLSPQEFHNILENYSENQIFENTKTPEITVSATGNAQADSYINKLAESRGYRLWPQADESALVELENGIKLQPKAKENYLKMLEAAKTEGVVIGVVSGYRSQEDQNTIFKPRLEALEMAQLGGYYTPEEFLTGQADEIIKQSMALTAPPGYSRHQTGYTVDLSDQTPDNTTTVFKGSKADIWLSKDNYANARRFGFIPSYPVGQQNIGPEPEPWEYVWVGNKAQ